MVPSSRRSELRGVFLGGSSGGAGRSLGVRSQGVSESEVWVQVKVGASGST